MNEEVRTSTETRPLDSDVLSPLRLHVLALAHPALRFPAAFTHATASRSLRYPCVLSTSPEDLRNGCELCSPVCCWRSRSIRLRTRLMHDSTSVVVTHHAACGYCATFGAGLSDTPVYAHRLPAPLLQPICTAALLEIAVTRRVASSAQPRAPPVL